jgi:two-component system invasion response regulator UvrY
VIKILVADDHPLIRAGLKQYIVDTNDIVVTDEACNGKEALQRALDNDYDVILLDITMPGINGLDVLKYLKTQKPNSKIIMLTVHPEEQYAARALKAGASGYLTKESAPQELISAIRQVASGGRYITSSFAEKLAFSSVNNTEKPLYQTLSDREYQIMLMIASGRRLYSIAEELLISVKTVSSHRSHILEKLNIKNNAELVRYTIDNNLM